MATLKEVAKRAGVTVTTVSRMLNDSSRVSAKTQEKIRRAMQEMHYHPNEIARSLAKQSSHFLGLIVSTTGNAFFSSLIGYVEKYASARGMKLLLAVSNQEPDKERDYFNMLLSNKVAGIILASHTRDVHDFQNIDAPVVTIERIISPHIPSACSDNYSGGFLAAELLIAKGCRKLLYVGGSAVAGVAVNQRFPGFRDACARHGVPEPAQADAPHSEFLALDYGRTVDELFALHPDVDGILASNDVIAAQILQYCHRHGIDVPGRLKLIGFDDTSVASLCCPALTSVHQELEAICRYAVDCVVQASAGETVPSSVTFPVRIVERETT